MFDKRFWTYLICAVIFGPIFTNILVSFNTPWTKGDIEGWISFFGNYSGGIIGGIVAYLIARYHFMEYKKNDDVKNDLAQLPVLIKLDYEIAFMVNSLKSIKDVFGHKANEEGENGFPRYKIWAYKTNEKAWDNIDRILDFKLQARLLVMKNFYLEFYESMNFDINECESKIEQAKAILEKLHTKGESSLEQQEKIFMYKNQILDLRTKIRYFKNAKNRAWQNFLLNDFLGVAEDLQLKIRGLKKSVVEKYGIDYKVWPEDKA